MKETDGGFDQKTASKKTVINKKYEFKKESKNDCTK